ncbi:inactive hydroxysteroid dehydrogenase-like protein 1 [Trichonephila clavata]|uniref:Inactive hydroxysteroid dehydrogenase-like protein 1 n=1 Tax=Trichonephila clavata TaxID=2740835 RepID=A0A8X6IR88_TRICU|nr:inactive hydroxysteroid dehydrogenase-like protein 1 [Trichonephila clavata]
MIDVLNLASSKQRRMASVDNFSFLFQGIHRNLRVYEEILAIIGLLYVGKTAFAFTWSFLQGVHTHVLARFRRLDLTRYGKWAVVTGGTDGIGKEYARALARHGLNIIIISRNKEKLEKTAQEIEKDFKVQTYIIQADFAAGQEIYNNISKQLEDKEIGILINNVGVMYDYPETFMNVPEKKLWELININIASVTMMTYIIIPQMVRRKKGVVVNMSSISSFHPLPLMAVYSASKVFVDWFSRALSYEYKDQGIIVQSLIPSYISTNLTRFSSFLQRPSFIVPDAKRFVNSAIQTIGVSNRTTGFWSHGLQYWMYDFMPASVWYRTSWLMQKIIDNHKRNEKKE